MHIANYESCETALHRVFGDTKLMSIIMHCVEVIHQTLGFSSKSIKGRQLLNQHCLADYIKYGAVEWFHASFSSSHMVNIFNNNLLFEAMLHPNLIILDTLLAHPRMTLNKGDKVELNQFINSLSMSFHTFPKWEQLLERYLSIAGPAAEDGYIIDHTCLVHSNAHPTFVRKLKQLGVTFSSDQLNVKEVDVQWLDKPWAPEMMILLVKGLLLDLQDAPSLIRKAIKRCGTTLTPLIKYSLFDASNKCNNITLMAKIYDLINIKSSKDLEPFSPLSTLSDALSGGHIEAVNYILDLPAQHPDSVDKNVYIINDIHHNIISLALIERLLAHTNFKCSFHDVLGKAIRAQNKEVVDMLVRVAAPRRSIIRFDLVLAFQEALDVGDVDSACMIGHDCAITLL
ncbi:hypothetical protein SAMD00019534_076390 [Acytostelium subglobosum LB1]|uniref:hypothetical protein n=1 Tax=Acytostelium subglobosum LB1 TaxID=1410327 RepID=UPI000644B73D|nr:hypothetical protein SAMD00019534_076390 [Acytostelium subglobosum LB1]GAM24464.1 hypothetical protein SAMD00019534_076390 [Acytostelium subglobosum LB1]|eukprot:XP_012752790.1 hypothetical protein SAMD00019534_076390 [Acytostelium subglobosum LB1]